MKIKNLSILFLVFISASSFNSVSDSAVSTYLDDSSLVKPLAREILTSQQLFVTELRKIKKNKDGNDVEYTAELRDAFRVISYTADSSYTELDWIMSSKYGQPAEGVYESGTPEYQKLDSLVNKIKIDLAKQIKH